MKSMPLKAGAGLCIAVLLTSMVHAQRPQKRRPAQPDSSKQITTPVPSLAGIPIIIDSSSMIDPIEPLPARTPGFAGLPADKRTPLPYENLRWDDALYVQKVWRELDLREKLNQPFRYDATDANGSQLFINILLRAVRKGEVQAFADERFTTPLSTARISEMITGKLDTVAKINPNSGVTDAWIVTRENFDPKTVARLLIMEEWIFDRESSRMFCRIIGIAPLKTRYIQGIGNKQTESATIMFWLNYPELRPVLANAEVYNPKNMGPNRMTWEELFESRMFSSHIVKTTLDNPSNRPISAYIKDPVLRLVEGDKIKEKIFSYEQDLWSY